MPDEVSLVDDLQRLSLQPSHFKAINKKAFTPLSLEDDFEAISPFKASFRVLMNYKDMVTFNFKAGTLLFIENLPNVFEVWPSISIKLGSKKYNCKKRLIMFLAVGFSSTERLGLTNTCYFAPIETPNKTPIPTAQVIEYELLCAFDPNEAIQLILKWLSINQFLSTVPSTHFITHHEKRLDFVLSCPDLVNEASIAQYSVSCTKLVVKKSTHALNEKSVSVPIGGLKNQLAELEDIISRALLQTEKSPAIKPSRGVLLFGPPGTGKTLLVKHVTRKYGLSVLPISASDFASSAYGEAEAKLQDLFNTAKKISPCVIFIDEIDSLCQKRDSHSSAASIRLTTLLLTLMDGCVAGGEDHKAERILFMGATNAVNSLDSALRRAGRFDREIEIPPPSRDDRLEILQTLIKKYPSTIESNELALIADACHGFVGADLGLLCKDAYLTAIARNESGEEVKLCFDNFISSLTRVKPSAMREVYVEVPKTKWTDIGGQHETKQKLIECVEWPIKVD